MGRKCTIKFNIGDTFLTWKVISCVNPKKYRYLCRCNVCGKEKEFIKYNLIRGSFAPCKTCAHESLNNLSTIKKHWNFELNGSFFTDPKEFDLSKKYWFLCKNNHNFKSSIKDFNPEACPSCRNKRTDAPSKLLALEYLNKTLRLIFDSVSLCEHCSIAVKDIETLFILEEFDRKQNFKKYYNSEDDFINDMNSAAALQNKFSINGFKIVNIPVKEKFSENVDKIEKLVLSLF